MLRLRWCFGLEHSAFLLPPLPIHLYLSFALSTSLSLPPTTVRRGHSPSWATSCCCLTLTTLPANVTSEPSLSRYSQALHGEDHSYSFNSLVELAERWCGTEHVMRNANSYNNHTWTGMNHFCVKVKLSHPHLFYVDEIFRVKPSVLWCVCIPPPQIKW